MTNEAFGNDCPFVEQYGAKRRMGATKRAMLWLVLFYAVWGGLALVPAKWLAPLF